MPKIWSKSVKIYQRMWKRQGRQFCDSCGMVVKDEHYYKWTVSYIAESQDWVNLSANSHTNPTCCGFTINALLQQCPTEEQQLIRSSFG